MKNGNCTDTMSSFVSPTGPRHEVALAGGTRAQGGVFKTIVATLFVWQERATMRHHLSQMDLTRLADIGLTYEEARREFEKPFWVA